MRNPGWGEQGAGVGRHSNTHATRGLTKTAGGAQKEFLRASTTDLTPSGVREALGLAVPVSREAVPALPSLTLIDQSPTNFII